MPSSVADGAAAPDEAPASSPPLDAPPAPSAVDADRFVLDCRGQPLDLRPGLEKGAQVMGILNVTPDSFSDGGQYLAVDDALARTEAMLEEGATVIDIGGESSRPAGSVYGEGAAQVEAEEEMERVLPVVEAVRDAFPEAILSVDTYKPPVARAVLEAGAHLINDITGLRHFPETADVAAEYGAPMVLMHSLGQPGHMPHTADYDDVVASVCDALTEAIDTARARGVQQIVTDPGFGFGKTAAENLRLLNRVDRLLALGYPVLVGISRKSTIGALLGTADAPKPVGERLYGSLGATAVAVMRGASLVRTHDVAATVEMLHTLGATVQQR
jgi:dihydropteroate synthase